MHRCTRPFLVAKMESGSVYIYIHSIYTRPQVSDTGPPVVKQERPLAAAAAAVSSVGAGGGHLAERERSEDAEAHGLKDAGCSAPSSRRRVASLSQLPE